MLLVLNTTGANATRWERTVAADAQGLIVLGAPAGEVTAVPRGRFHAHGPSGTARVEPGVAAEVLNRAPRAIAVARRPVRRRSGRRGARDRRRGGSRARAGFARSGAGPSGLHLDLVGRPRRRAARARRASAARPLGVGATGTGPRANCGGLLQFGGGGLGGVRTRTLAASAVGVRSQALVHRSRNGRPAGPVSSSSAPRS